MFCSYFFYGNLDVVDRHHNLNDFLDGYSYNEVDHNHYPCDHPYDDHHHPIGYLDDHHHNLDNHIYDLDEHTLAIGNSHNIHKGHNKDIAFDHQLDFYHLDSYHPSFYHAEVDYRDFDFCHPDFDHVHDNCTQAIYAYHGVAYYLDDLYPVGLYVHLFDHPAFYHFVELCDHHHHHYYHYHHLHYHHFQHARASDGLVDLQHIKMRTW